ncbi:uncharacterized protein EAF02_005252 [Botrytis sinoallii]|uniref:uncharacterized protein n=1 Tax=Botrytis sinoallii TaxID=1463999 RepID=UPI0019028BEC|nr:uncharacterized protein EAF02_005252 [Botrytis sinoallii]KAF7883332.1 hypothetical protein EAF02_005252 [Botrytis sinoallii]
MPGLFATAEEVQQLLALLVTLKIGHIDTAAIYPLSSHGKSEQLLGENHAHHSFAIDTKIKLADFSGKGSLTASAINESVAESLSRIKAKINVLYCHMPDASTPINETLAALHELHQQNKFQKLGISNFSVAQLQELLEACEKEGYPKPSYYQGQYNALCREAETQLLPILCQQKISYIAHSPLAGGFLTGIFTLGTDVTGTRFEDGNPKGDFFKRRYDNEPTHSTMKEFIALLQPYDITPSEAALRWIYYHSALQEGDGVILGASNPAQISLNAADIAKGPLPSNVAEAMEKMWTNIQAQM